MKKIIALLMAVAFLAVTASLFAAPKAPETVVVKEMQKKKAPVPFPHKLHGDKFGCKECHHKWKGGDVEPEKCTKCHTNKKEGKKLKAKNAYHKKCKGCHKKMKKAGKKTGPTSCKGCHKK
jgi:hypothetical protein